MNGIIWSLQKQGNTYIRNVIVKNFGKDCRSPARIQNHVSNHAGYTEFDRESRYHVVVRKDLFSWLISIHKWYTVGAAKKDHGKTCPKNFSEFLRWNFERREPQFPRTSQCPKHRREMGIVSTGWTPAEYWERYHKHWFDVDVNGEKIFLHYEDFLTDFNAVMEVIQMRTGWERVTNKWTNDVKMYMPSAGGSGTFKKKDWYIKSEYMKAFTDEDLQFVIDNMDVEFYNRIGYTLP